MAPCDQASLQTTGFSLILASFGCVWTFSIHEAKGIPQFPRFVWERRRDVSPKVGDMTARPPGASERSGTEHRREPQILRERRSSPCFCGRDATGTAVSGGCPFNQQSAVTFSRGSVWTAQFWGALTSPICFTAPHIFQKCHFVVVLRFMGGVVKNLVARIKAGLDFERLGIRKIKKQPLCLQPKARPKSNFATAELWLCVFVSWLGHAGTRINLILGDLTTHSTQGPLALHDCFQPSRPHLRPGQNSCQNPGDDLCVQCPSQEHDSLTVHGVAVTFVP